MLLSQLCWDQWSATGSVEGLPLEMAHAFMASAAAARFRCLSSCSIHVPDHLHSHLTRTRHCTLRQAPAFQHVCKEGKAGWLMQRPRASLLEPSRQCARVPRRRARGPATPSGAFRTAGGQRSCASLARTPIERVQSQNPRPPAPSRCSNAMRTCTPIQTNVICRNPQGMGPCDRFVVWQAATLPLPSKSHLSNVEAPFIK